MEPDDLSPIFDLIPHGQLHDAYEREMCRRSLHYFITKFWYVVEPGRVFIDNWHIKAICLHLEAVTNGDITRLLINVPPGAMKSLIVNVFWPAWEWGARGMPWLRYLSASYSEDLTVRDNRRCRAIIASDLYQRLFGDVVQIDPRQDATGNYANTAKGWRIATSVGGVGTGERADRVCCDDPHSVKTADSSTIREATLHWWREVIPTRVNDASKSAFIVIMQRVHDEDVSGDILKTPGWTHVMIPMRFEPERSFTTKIGWRDPRTELGELFWPERFPDWTVVRDSSVMGRFAVASQFQQSPEVRGGGIIKRDDWRVWPPVDQEEAWYEDKVVDGRTVRALLFPLMDYVLLSADTAFTTKEENDWSAVVVLGVFRDAARNPKIMLLEAWRERLELRGIVEKMLDTSRRRLVDAVLVEAKASGLDVISEMRRLMRDGEFSLLSHSPKEDKMARLHSVSPLFEDGLVYAPNRKYAEMVIDEAAAFPRAKHDDLVDALSAGLRHLRKIGLAQFATEVEADRLEAITFRGNRDTVREEYGV